MKTAILVFIESQLGGLGTQAYDLARTAYEMHGCGKVVVITSKKQNVVTPINEFTVSFGPTKNKKELSISDCHLSSSLATSQKVFSYLSQFDCRIWIGLAPHCKTQEETAFFSSILESLPGKDHAFVTDRYIDDLYPWIIPHLKKFDSINAFADTYATAVRKHSPCGVLPIAPLMAWKQRNFIAPSKKKNHIFWPHQWRTWKNIEMFLDIAPRLDCNKIDFYASGRGYEYSGFLRSPQYKKHVFADAANPSQKNSFGKLNLKGFARHQEILQSYLTHKCVPDLTGISPVNKISNKYVGNYQCATLEPMAFGCAVLKFSTTVFPHSGIPKEAVYILEPEQKDYAKIINNAMRDDGALDRAARNAYEWLESKCDPYALFDFAFNCR
jgi:glycosyltransferase involved in cell wall biosynthesis